MRDKSGGLGTEDPSGVQERSPGSRSGDGVTQKLEHFQKYTSRILRPCENERHNLVPLVAFFYCSAHQIVFVSVSCCTMFGILGAWPDSPPGSATGHDSVSVFQVSIGFSVYGLVFFQVGSVFVVGFSKCRDIGSVLPVFHFFRGGGRSSGLLLVRVPLSPANT